MANYRNAEAEYLHFFKNRWKPSQKMRLDALIIFHIEWRHQVSCSMGKQSKYWSEENETENHVFFKNGWKPSQKTRLDALIIFHIEWPQQVSSWVGKQSKYWSEETRPKIIYFLRMAGNHLKRCALMRWLFSILNDDTKYLVWWVNNRNTEAKKARPKSCFFKEWLESVRLAPWSPNFR